MSFEEVRGRLVPLPTTKSVALTGLSVLLGARLLDITTLLASGTGCEDWCRTIGVRSKKARQRLVLCRLMIDMMRTVHGAYAPASEPFGTRLETFYIALCVALGDIDGKPFSVAKIAAYMRVPRTTVIRRLDQLRRWGLIDRQGRR